MYWITFIQFIRAVTCIIFQFYICFSETNVFTFCDLFIEISQWERGSCLYLAKHGNFYDCILEYKYESINPFSSLHSWISFSLFFVVMLLKEYSCHMRIFHGIICWTKKKLYSYFINKILFSSSSVLLIPCLELGWFSSWCKKVKLSLLLAQMYISLPSKISVLWLLGILNHSVASDVRYKWPFNIYLIWSW